MVTIVKWTDAAEIQRAAGALDAIFFEASGTKAFASDEVRQAFRERWLGRYLRVYPEWAYLALGNHGQVDGYLIGCLDDPSKTLLFSDIGYFQDLRALTARFPAQLHVNLAPTARGAGAGSKLVSRFVDDAAQAGCPGAHVVTGRGLRNVGFYERNGFQERGHVTWNGHGLVFLGRDLKSGG